MHTGKGLSVANAVELDFRDFVGDTTTGNVDGDFIPHFMPHWREAAALIVKAIKTTSL